MSDAKTLSPSVREKLRTAVQAWADENLPERPAVLGYACFTRMEKELLKIQLEIEEAFPK